MRKRSKARMTTTAPRLLCLLLLVGCTLGSTQLRTLQPDEPIDNLHITPTHVNSRSRLLFGVPSSAVRPNSFYEIRVSYPAVFPAQFTLTFVDGLDARDHIQQPRRRRLLNIEKIMFQSNEHGELPFMQLQVNSQRVYVLEVRASFDGRAVDAKVAARSVPFNLVMETLVYNAPLDALKLAGLLLPALAFVWCIVRPRLAAALVPLRQERAAAWPKKA